MRTRQFQQNRFFVSQDYSVYYRRLKKLHWLNEIRPGYGVLFLLSGNLNYRVAESTGVLNANQLLLLNPGAGATGTAGEVEFLLMDVSPAFVLDHAARMGLVGSGSSVAFRERVLPSDHLLQLGRGLVNELLEENPGQDIVIPAQVEQILVELLRFHANMRRADQLELSRVGLIDRRIRRSVELMHVQLEHDLSLKAIAAASYLSPFHFARLFKKLTGLTPHAYLAALRTNQAQFLLAKSDLTITEISARVGYASPSHFTKSFRVATGLTPRAFRQASISR